MLKKLLSYLMVIVLLSSSLWLGLVEAQFYEEQPGWENVDQDVDVRAGDEWPQEEWIIDWIQTVVNWALWLMWLVALIMLLWWGFLMVTAAGEDDRYQKWFKILKQAWIGLLLIWVAWLIVSIIFRVIGLD